MRLIFGIFPLLAVPVLIYNLMVGITPLADHGPGAHAQFAINMVSGAKWEIFSGDILIIIAMIFFFIEILKATSTGTASIVNLSLIHI